MKIENEIYENLKNIKLTSLNKGQKQLISEFQSIKSYPNLIKKGKIEQDSELILLIQKFLWNEISYNDLENLSELLFFIIYFWKLKIFQNVDLRVFLRLYYINNGIDDEDLVHLIFVLKDTSKITTLDEWLDFILDNNNDLISSTPSLNEAISLFSSKFNDEDNRIEYWKNINSRISFIEKHDDYFDQALDSIDKKELLDLLNWIAIDKRDEIVNYVINRELKEIEPFISIENYKERIQNTDLLKDMPVSLPVLQENISRFTPSTLDMDVISHVPPKFVQEWAPKFVYSKPEIPLKFKILFPGGDNIGHSGIIIKTSVGSLLLDFGLSVVNNTTPKWLPILDKLDAIFISHAHIDHSGGLPLLYTDNSKIPWFATKETKLMAEMLYFDTQNINKKESNFEIRKNDFILRELTRTSNILNVIGNYNEIKVGETYTILPKINIKIYNASHLFGSTGFEFNIDGKRLLYTGDFNLDGTINFKGAEFPSDVDINLFDGTNYKRYEHETYQNPDKDLISIFQNSKRVIIPAFSLGRSQEILFHLKKHNLDKEWKIYVTGMGGNLTKKLALKIGNEGKTKTGIEITKTIDEEKFKEKTIVICGQGMLQAGTSRKLLEASKNDEDTSVILTGYQAPNTMGYHLYNKNEYLQLNYKQHIYRLKLSGHSSGKSLDKFIDNQSGKLIIVHCPEETSVKNKKIVRPSSQKIWEF